VFKEKKPLLFIPLLALFVFIFILPQQNLVPLKGRIISFFKSPLKVSYRIYLSILNARKIFTFYSEYNQMKLEIGQLKYALNRSREFNLENQRLRQILEIKEADTFGFIAARVIGKEPTNWLNSLIIDKGSTSGIFVNQPIMQLNGLIGKIIETGSDTAKVLLISDVNSRVVVLVQRTRQDGMLEGIGDGLCRLKYLPVDADVKLGDVIISAGVGGVYPKGLLIGNVESVKIERGGIYKSCIIKPASRLSGLEEVLCLKSNSEL